MGADEEDKLLKEIDAEFKAIQKLLHKSSVDDDQYENIVSPLVAAVAKLNHKQRKFSIALKSAKISLCIALIIIIIQGPWFHKVFSVIGRYFLIQVLPVWDWTRIYYSDCILTNPFYEKKSVSAEDCRACQSLEEVERLVNAPPKLIWKEFISNDVPFIIHDGMEDWPVMNTDNFWFENITELYLSEKLSRLESCEFTTNLKVAKGDLQRFLYIIQDPGLKRWVGHWENCDKKAAKALRPLYRRPYFLPNMVDISDSNWVLISSDYISRYYHQLDFSSELLWVAQVRGWIRFQLTPKEPCNYFCQPLTSTLREGQIVVLTNFMWEFSYKPGEGTDNLAIAVGGTWNY